MKTWNILYNNEEDLFQLKSVDPRIDQQSMLIQVFTAIHAKEQIASLLSSILRIFPQAHIIGTTTKASIYQGRIVEDACVLSVTSLRDTNLSTYTYEKEGTLLDESIGSIMGTELSKGTEKAAIIFSRGDVINFEEFLEGFSLKQPNVIVTGGTSVRNNAGESFVFNNSGIVENGITMVVFENPQLLVHTNFNIAWTPIGRKYEVTKASGNLIQEIDHIPAKIWYQKYIGYESALQHDVGYQFPLMIERGGIYIAKAILGYTEQGEIRIKNGVKAGDKIRLGYRDLNEAIQNSRRLCKEVEKYPIETLFAYSCISRFTHLKELAQVELVPFKDQVEVSGFHSSGEFIHNQQENMYASKAISVLGMSESAHAPIQVNLSCFDDLLRNDEQVILSHLIKSTNQELDLFNYSLELKVKEQTNQLKEFYYTDELTQLSNKNRFNRDFQRHRLSKVALLDIEDFTMINNFYGSQVGNYILREFAVYVKREMNALGFKVYRIQSDTFAIAGDDSFTDEAFTQVIKELQRTLNEKSFSANVHEIYLSILAVIAIKERQLLEKALLTLDYLKFKKIPFQIYHPLLKIEDELGKNIKWIKKIKDAIQCDRIVPYFQPIYNNRTHKIDKYEALIRLIDEDGSVISPYHFLHIAKQTNIYPTLTVIMVQKTFEAFKDKPYDFSINLTVEDMLDKGTREHIFEQLSKFKKPQQVIFEIVETEKIENFSEVKEFISIVKGYGAKIAIDDFGTGYSNLSYLVQLQVDMIKVDGSIIKNIIFDETSNLVAKTILDLSKRLGVKTVAEYVENEEIFNKVVALDMDYSQGYYFSKPIDKVV